MTTKTSATQQYILAAGGQGSLKSGLITCTWIGKNCAVPSLRLDTDPAKEDNSLWRCRRVTLTTTTAGPLGLSCRRLNTLNINSFLS